jgi:hypothetical protein
MRDVIFPRADVVKNPHEISTICAELEKVGSRSELFSQLTVESCNQAAYLLSRMRLVGYSKAPDGQIVEAIREMLQKQGDG